MARGLGILSAAAQRGRMGPCLLCGSARTADEHRAMTVAYPSRACPICGAAGRRVFFHQQFAAVDQATPVTGYEVVVCERCGGGYADGIPDQPAFDRYYRDMAKYEYPQRGVAESEFASRLLT